MYHKFNKYLSSGSFLIIFRKIFHHWIYNSQCLIFKYNNLQMEMGLLMSDHFSNMFHYNKDGRNTH